MRAPVSLSRLPVGSSAKRSRGELLNARAIATRCCSPPESWFGKWCDAVAESDAGEELTSARGAPVVAAQLERHLHVLERGERRNQLKALEHEPNFRSAQAGRGGPR